VPAEIAGAPVHALTPTASQAAQGITAVSTNFDSRAVKTFVNVGRQRYYGTEAELRQDLTVTLHLGCNYPFLHGRELNPSQNVRRLPPQEAWLSLKYRPPSGFWLEGSVEAAGAQRRLSGGDLSDERIGAERSRNEPHADGHPCSTETTDITAPGSTPPAGVSSSAGNTVSSLSTSW